MISQATVETRYGASYLKRLCRHFAHKVPAVIDGAQGRIELPFAFCRIDTDDEYMRFHLDIDDVDKADLAEQVITDHLLRMANKDQPGVRWDRAES